MGAHDEIPRRDQDDYQQAAKLDALSYPLKQGDAIDSDNCHYADGASGISMSDQA